MKYCLPILFFFIFLANTSLAQKRQPYNVLFITIDDLNDYISLLNDYPGLKTPNLDKFAKTAINFTHAYTAAPACNSSRTAILTGLSPARTGMYENKDFFQNSSEAMEATLLPEHLKKNGYRTMWSGKIFHSGENGVKSHPGEKRMEEMWDDKEGYDGGYGPRGTEANIYGAKAWFNYQEWQGSDEDFPDISNGDITIERLQQEYDRPFFMAMGFYRPHTPWTAPKRFFEMYPLDEVQLPEVLENDLDDVPPIGREWAHSNVKLDELKKMKKWKYAVRAYLASISFVDYSLGRVLEALEKSPHRDNTIVIILSDHGFHMGEKQHFTKFALWEQTTHTLLMARIPGQTTSGIRDQPVNLLDLYPTLVDYCNLSDVENVSGVKQTLDGNSLRPVIEDAGFERKEPSITYFINGSMGMRTRDWRYIRYYDGSEELYNSKKDSKEWHNLADNPSYEKVKASFSKWIPDNIALDVGRKRASK